MILPRFEGPAIKRVTWSGREPDIGRIDAHAGARRSGQRGFALLIVLWTMVLLSLVAMRLMSAGHDEAELASNLRRADTLQAAADGAVYQGIFHLLDATQSHWSPDGLAHLLRLSQGTADVSIEDLGGRVNPNIASLALLSALLQELGADLLTSDSIAQAIADWRTPDNQGRFKAPQYKSAGLGYGPARSAFQSLEEVGLVMGMTPALLVLMLPHLSLFNSDNPDPALADPVVRRAIVATDPEAVLKTRSNRPTRTVRITATVISFAGDRARRQAEVRLGNEDGRKPSFEILAWNALPL